VGNTWIAGGGDDTTDFRRLAKPPSQSVFSATTADYKNFQEKVVLPLE
jgi:hypothetical protein